MRSTCFSEAEFAQFRAEELPIYARGFSYLATTEFLGECTASIDVGEAYPGIDGDAFWATVFVEKMVDVSWKSPGAPDPEGKVFAVVLASENAEVPFSPGPYDTLDPFQPRLFVNAFPYGGPAEGASPAQFLCPGDVEISPENTFIVRRWFGETERAMEISLGLPIHEIVSELEEIERPIETLSQEVFVFPREAVTAVVGPVNEVPPLPVRPESTVCNGSD